MRTGLKIAFRPSLERFEARIVAAAGVVSAAAHHVAPQHAAHVTAHPATHAAPHHASQTNQPASSHPAAAASKTVTTTTKTTTTTTTTTTSSSTQQSPPAASLPTNTTTNQAWVKLVNMTGEPLEYQIKLGPYANGQFLPFDIGAGATQYQMSSLIANGQRVNADFAIQFGNGPITPLNPGISQASAQGYYIFLDSNFQPYVTPFISS